MSATLQGSSGSIELGSTIIGVGRSPENQLIVQDADASWLHAQITPQGQEHILVDLGSKNGTFVNGQRLTPKVPRRLNNGDTVLFGNTAFNYMNSALTYPPTRTAGSTPSHEPTRTEAPASFANSGSIQTPPPPPLVRQQTPTQIIPVEKEKGDGKWVKIFAGLASLATIFGVIWGVYVYMHPTTNPQLHGAYNGTYTNQTGVSLPFTITGLTEDANGNFSASGNISVALGSCQTTYQGSVSSNNALHFSAKLGSPCSDVSDFTGQLFPDGHLAGTWQDPAGQGSWTAS